MHASTRGVPTRAGLVVLSLLAFSSQAFAQSGYPAIELERLTLNPNGQGSTFMGTGKLLERHQFRLLAAASYQRYPWRIETAEGVFGSLVGYRNSVHLGGAFGVTDWLELGAAWSAAVYQSGDDFRPYGLSPLRPRGGGTPEVMARVGLLSAHREDPFDLALEVRAGIPVGSSAALGRDARMRYAPAIQAGGNVAWLRLGLELGMLFRPTVVLSPGADPIRDELGNEVHVGASMVTRNEGLRAELGARVTVPLTETAAGTEVMAGLRYARWQQFEPFLLGAVGFGALPAQPLYRVMGGFHFGSGAKPLPAVVAAAAPPPPEPPPAPEPPPQLAAIEPPAPVCVAGEPHEPSDCPDLDLDGDGIANRDDACARLAGSPPDGCAKAEEPSPLVEVTKERLELHQKIHFQTGRAEVKRESFPLLDAIVDALSRNPQITLVRIVGHTDDRGRPATNLLLSTKRAEAVRAALVQRGIEPSRLLAEGKGSTEPVVPNLTAKGREANRRVEFIIPEQQ